MSGAGYDWLNEGSSVSGVTFNDVARDPLLGTEGDDSIIPSSVVEGEEVNYVMDSFEWNEDYIKENSTVVVMLLNDNTGEVINAVESELMDLIIVENNGVTYYVIDGDTFQLWDGEYLVPTGIQNTATTAPMRVYPNPSSSFVNIVSSEITSESSIQILDMTGRVVWNGSNLGVQQTGHGKGVRVNVSKLPSGLYHVVINNREESIKQSISVIH